MWRHRFSGGWQPVGGRRPRRSVAGAGDTAHRHHIRNAVASMTRTRIKICGITNATDAALAASLGADYIGVIFADSPRRVDLSRAKEIRDIVPDVSMVGVFRNQPLGEVVDIARASGIDLVQLH